MNRIPGYATALLIIVFVISAFIVPIAGPLRSSGAHLLVALAVVVLGVIMSGAVLALVR
jgi:NADH:ubiquinone oxidoreductase subunit 3 (subunit A)